MATGGLKKQLALAVRSIQWSYAIFWSISARQPGVLEWGDGYYNGDIKTRKTIHSIELNADPLGLQRSEQLRELFQSLSAGEASPQAKRPSAALSPEDLTDTEWYYLVCMSFQFNIGQGLPGRTLATGQPIWLCNAHYADSKVFSRSLLAKSASIQTVLCFPFSGGVIELGANELALEDPSLIQHIKASYLEVPLPVVDKKSSLRSDPEIICAAFNHEIHDSNLIPCTDCEEAQFASPKNSSNDKEAGDSSMLEERNGGASQEKSWLIMDDDFSNCILYSVNSSDSISQTILDPIKDVLAPDDKTGNNRSPQDVQDCNHTKQCALGGDDMHYQSILSSLLKTSRSLILGPHSQNGLKESSFLTWKKVGSVYSHKSKGGTTQKLLKKILFEVPRMHTNGLPKSPENSSDRIGVLRLEAEDNAKSHEVSERKRREKINERFSILKSLVPSIGKVDKVSILDDTIVYVQELERRIEELESCKEITDSEAWTKRKSNETVERSSDNYGSAKNANGRRQYQNKRKACDIDEMMPEDGINTSRDGSTCSVSVNTNEKDVQIEIKCLWREGILLEIMDATSHFYLDSYSVQSTTTNGILSVTIKSKPKGLTAASAGAIKQALERVARKC